MKLPIKEFICLYSMLGFFPNTLSNMPLKVINMKNVAKNTLRSRIQVMIIIVMTDNFELILIKKKSLNKVIMISIMIIT
jgi:hypothetical protein